MTLHQPQPFLSVDNVSLARDGREILKDVNLKIFDGDFVAITGPNGGGKTTLLRIMLGLQKPDSGIVKFFDPNRRIGYLPQKNTIDAHFPISVEEVVRSGLLANHELNADEVRFRTAETLALVEMDSFASRPIGRLSGGQLQRVLLARAIVAKPSLLMLDEPLSYIDRHFTDVIYSLLRSLARTTTIVLVSHDMQEIATMANRHIFVDRTVAESEGYDIK